MPFDPHVENTLQIVADLGDNPSLADVSTFFGGVQDLLYVGGLFARRGLFTDMASDYPTKVH